VDKSSSVGVLDKSVAILDALELRPRSLNELAEATGISRPTAHRLAVALETHGLLARDGDGRFLIGPRIGELAAASGGELPLLARPVLRRLRDACGESTQLYQRAGDRRICVAVADRASGLRDTVPLGASMTMTAGSAAQVLLAWDDTAAGQRLLSAAAFTADTLAEVRRLGWAASTGEREPGVGSVSSPVRGPSGRVVAALSISGPLERLGTSPGQRFAAPVAKAARELSAALATPAASGAPVA
jgi:DNA-binding IclR family transcriptional regulator